MKVLVTGGAGFIGRNLVVRLYNSGHDVTVVDNFVCFHNLFRVPNITFPEGVKIVHCDIRNLHDFNKIEGNFDKVYHLAASFANELSVDYPEIDMESNIVGTMNVIQFANRHGVKKIVYVGSSSSYGYPKEPMREDMEMHPGTPYALSKLIGEDYVKMNVKNVDFAIFRLFNVFGRFDYPGKYRNAIPQMAYKALTEKKIIVYGENSGRDFTPVDLVTYVLSNDERVLNDVVNIGTGFDSKMIMIANVIKSFYDDGENDDIEIEVLPTRIWDKVITRRADNSKLLALYPELEIPVGAEFVEFLTDTLEWLREIILS